MFIESFISLNQTAANNCTKVHNIKPSNHNIRKKIKLKVKWNIDSIFQIHSKSSPIDLLFNIQLYD